MKSGRARDGKKKGARAGKKTGTRNEFTQKAKHDAGARTSGPHSRNEALADRDADGWLLRAPRVGIFRRLLEPGQHARPGEPIGTLEVLQRRIDVVPPAEVDGLVAEAMLPDRTQAVDYGQILLRIRAGMAVGSRRAHAPVSKESSSTGGAALPAGCHPVLSPIDGIFYTRPSPGAPPFLEAGAVIQTGRTIGLVEAMKSFNAIAYGGPGLPSPAVVIEIRAADASEVRQGAILLVVRAA